MAFIWPFIAVVVRSAVVEREAETSLFSLGLAHQQVCSRLQQVKLKHSVPVDSTMICLDSVKLKHFVPVERTMISQDSAAVCNCLIDRGLESTSNLNWSWTVKAHHIYTNLPIHGLKGRKRPDAHTKA